MKPNLLKDLDGLSPLIGTVLVLAITFLLAGVIATSLFGGEHEDDLTPAPVASLSVAEYNNTTLKVIHNGGDSIDFDNSTTSVILNFDGKDVKNYFLDSSSLGSLGVGETKMLPLKDREGNLIPKKAGDVATLKFIDLKSQKPIFTQEIKFVYGSESATKATPTISWNNPADITYGTTLDSKQLNAVAKNPINGADITGTFTYDPAEGTTPNAGDQTLSVSFQTTDPNYTPGAISQSVTLTVNKADPTITWSPNPSIINYGTGLVAGQLNAEASFNGAPVTGTFAYDQKVEDVLGAGSQTLTAKFSSTDPNINDATASATITVWPNADFSNSTQKQKSDYHVVCTETGGQTSDSCKWNFGDTTKIYGPASSQSHIYAYIPPAQTYTITMYVTNSAGSYTITKQIQVPISYS
jgi:flagellin-like protein